MRKRSFKTVIAAVLLFSMLSVPAFAESATVTGSDVNLRSGPGTGYPVVDCLPRGATVEVTDRSDSSWYAVVYNGQSGFMSSRYLSISDDGNYAEIIPDYTPDAPAQPTQDTEVPAVTPSDSTDGCINAMYVRFRSGPNTSSSILGTYNKGKQISITGTSGDWTACVINGQAGYVFSSYVTAGTAPAQQPATGDGSGTDSTGGEMIVSDDGTQIIIGGTVPDAPAGGTESEGSGSDGSGSSGTGGSSGGLEIIPDSGAGNETPVETPDTGAGSPGTISGDYVRFRKGPSTNYSIINTYNRGKALSVIGADGDWSKCVIDGTTGYVFTQYVSLGSGSSGTVTVPETAPSGDDGTSDPADGSGTGNAVIPTESKAGYITGNSVRFRSGPSTSSDILGEFNYGNSVTITGVSGSWTAVTYSGQEGFVFSQYVTEGTFSYTSTGVEETGVITGGGSGSEPATGYTGSATGSDIANYALRYVGCSYCWGGTSPDTGFDCSGLVYYTYQHFGITLNRVAADQALNGVHVDSSKLKPGDILCFYSGGSYIGHSGIYIGDGKFVHAANSSTGVIVSDLSGYYSTRGFEARRIV